MDKERATAFTTYFKTLTDLQHAIDTFRASLFVTASSESGTSDKTANPKSTDVSASKSGSSDANPAFSPQASAQKTPSGGVPFGRLIAADLLARAILGNIADDYDETDFSDVHLLILQTSGGGVLTRGGLFTGNRVNFSGGAATTFSLFDLEDGSIECSGNTFAYSGYFQQDRYPTHLRDDVVGEPLQITDQSGECATSVERPIRTWRDALKQKPKAEEIEKSK